MPRSVSILLLTDCVLKLFFEIYFVYLIYEGDRIVRFCCLYLFNHVSHHSENWHKNGIIIQQGFQHVIVIIIKSHKNDVTMMTAW